MAQAGKHSYTVPAALSRAVMILGVESRLFVITMMMPVLLFYTGMWLYGSIFGAVMYIIGRLMTSSDHQYMLVLISALRLNKKAFLPDVFDEGSRDMAFQIVPDSK